MSAGEVEIGHDKEREWNPESHPKRQFWDLEDNKSNNDQTLYRFAPKVKPTSDFDGLSPVSKNNHRQ